MSEKLRTIRLYGVAGSKFGRIHRMAVSSTEEAIRALGVVLPGFKKFMVNAKDNGLTFAVFVGKQNLTEEQLEHPVGDDDIRIAPILIGSKSSGVFQTIFGAVLFAVGAVSTYFGNPYGGNMMAMGAAMALGGVAQLLSPHVSGLNGTGADNGTSYYFNGPVNSSAQGDVAQVVIGRFICGSKRISSGIYAEDQA
jgi:predicted phage tail protein